MVASAEPVARVKIEPRTEPALPAQPTVQVGEPLPGAPRRGRGRLIFGVVLTAVLGLGGSYLWSQRGNIATDDAQVDADVVAVPARVGGVVARVVFEENQRVEAGALLVELDDSTYQAKVKQAQAMVDAAAAAADAADADAKVAALNANGNRDVTKAALLTASVGAAFAGDQIKEAEAAVKSAEAAQKQAEADRARARSLLATGAIAKAEADRVETGFDLASSNTDAARARLATLRAGAAQAQSKVVEASAKADQTSDVVALVAQAQARARAAHAQVETAEAALQLAKIDLANTKIYAPQSGVLSKKTALVGQTLSPGQTIAQLVTPVVWVTANFKETQLRDLRVGQRADVQVDAFDGKALHGEVDSVSGATGSRFTLLPPDNASGNFTKVVQRVPVRVRVVDAPTGLELRPGMSVELVVHTR